MRSGRRIISTILLLLSAAVAQAASTTAQLILSHETARPGETVWAGVHLRMAPKWHTYWQNGGDSGGPTKIEWTLLAGVTAGEIQWPVPERYVTAGLVTYVYHNAVVLLVPLSVAPNVSAGALDISARVSWLECEEQCLQGRGQVSAKLTVGSESKPSKDVAVIDEWKKKLPLVATNVFAHAWWESSVGDETRPAIIEWDLADKPVEADFFPYGSTQFKVSGATERVDSPDGKIRLRKSVEKLEGDWPTELAGVLITKQTKDAPAKGVAVKLSIGAAPVEKRVAAPLSSILPMLGFAFLGGLILNIMPCVLPVIALKVLGFVNQAKETPERVRRLGVIYGLGVLVSFLVLAGLAIAVQQAGGRAGWSTAFQNPQFRVLITTLITLVALNLFGVFEITLGSAMDAASQLTSKEGTAGAFFNGVLATVLATPCTAPFMGVAIGFAFTQPPFIIVLMFLAVGLGLAAPFVALCWQPRWLKLLPKPGAWMERFKIAMGFPMLATAMWLFWLTGTRLGNTGVLWLGMFLVLLALAAWIWGEFVQRGTKRKGLSVLICLLLVGAAYGGILEKQLRWREPPGKRKEGIDWKRWTPEAVEQARREGHPVLVDFTADTCLNCQVNKITSLDIDSTRTKLKEINAATFLADFTDEDPVIARELQRFGRAGVPLVLVYPRDTNQPPLVLPALLTPSIVQEALDKAGK